MEQIIRAMQKLDPNRKIITIQRKVKGMKRWGIIAPTWVKEKGMPPRPRYVLTTKSDISEIAALRVKLAGLEAENKAMRAIMSEWGLDKKNILPARLKDLISDIPPLRVTESHAPEYKPTEDEIRERERHERNKAIYEERS